MPSRPRYLRAGEKECSIEDSPGYTVTDHGRVLSRRQKGKLRELKFHRRGVTRYTSVTIMNQKGYQKHRAVHILVLEAFRGACPKGYKGAHLNGNRTDNRITNVAWVTEDEYRKLRKKFKMDRRVHGERHHFSRLTHQQAQIIREDEGKTSKALADEFGVAISTIQAVKTGRTWTNANPGKRTAAVIRKEMVDHPEHYTPGTYEVYKVLHVWGLESDALLWNAVKYIARAGKKDNKTQDLEKAMWYLKERLRVLREDKD